MHYSSALSILKGAPIEGIRILVNVWIIMKVRSSYHRQAVITSVKSGYIIDIPRLNPIDLFAGIEGLRRRGVALSPEVCRLELKT